MNNNGDNVDNSKVCIFGALKTASGNTQDIDQWDT